MVQMCCEDIMFVRKIFFLLNTFQLPENSFVRKMVGLPQLLISLVKSQFWFINQVAQFSMDQKLAIELCVKATKSMTVYKRLKKANANKIRMFDLHNV